MMKPFPFCVTASCVLLHFPPTNYKIKNKKDLRIYFFYLNPFPARAELLRNAPSGSLVMQSQE